MFWTKKNIVSFLVAGIIVYKGEIFLSKIYLIGNAHIDPVWLWRWQEGYAEILATVRSALDRMKDFDDFCFSFSAAAFYEWVEKTDPYMFEEIRERVKEGRWCIVGGWFIEPDLNIPCGESFARHALLSQHYFMEKFGVTAKTGFNVDSFGHNANLPKILKMSGLINYVFMRPFPEEQGRDEMFFMWESDDESKVLTYRIPWFYNYDLSRMECFSLLKEKAEKDKMDYMAFYGVGNHGGGPTIALIDAINKLGIEDMEYSVPDRYFEAVNKDKVPTYKGELQHHARGCYSAESKIKKLNRKCEHNLIAAEKLSVMAKELLGAEYPGKELSKAWKNVLFNQFHDILGGCCVKKAYEDAAYFYGEALSITEHAINDAMQKIAWNIDTLEGETLPSYKSHLNWKIWQHEVLGTPIVVFNTGCRKTKAVIKVNQNAKMITDKKGQEIPFQLVRGDQTNGDDKYHTAFIAEIPAMGYATYRLFAEKEGKALFENEFTATETLLENSKIRVEFDERTGEIKSFYNKEKNKYIIDKPLKAVLIDDSRCDTWAHNKKSLGESAGSFGNPEFKIIENGNVLTVLRVTQKYENSVIIRDYMLTAESDVLKVNVKVCFNHKHRVLKLTFPLENETVKTNIPYGTIERKGYTGEEPCGSFIASGFLCVANDSKHAYDTENEEMRLTVLRSAIYADHYGKRDEFCEFMDMGVSEFAYSVFTYESDSDAEAKAEELNFPLLHIMGSFHKGKLPLSFSGLDVRDENIVITAVKKAEDSEETVVRAYEAEGKKTSARINIFGKEIKAEFFHNEVKTFKGESEVNMLEWRQL